MENDQKVRLQRLVRRSARLLGWTALGMLACLTLSVGVLRFAVNGPRLGRLVATQLEKQFCGQFDVDRLEWRLPLSLRLQGLQVRPPGGTPAGDALRLEALDLQVRLWPLLRHRRLCVARLALRGLQLRAHQAGADQPLALLRAFAPRRPAPPEADEAPPASLPLPIDLVAVRLDGLQVAWTTPAMQLRLEEGQLHDGSVQAAGRKVLTSGNFTAKLALPRGPGDGRPQAMALQWQQLRATWDPLAAGVDVARVTLRGVGVDLALQGNLQLPPTRNTGAPTPPQARGSLQLQVNGEDPALRALLPPSLAKVLHGGAQLQATATPLGDGHRLGFGLRGTPLSFAGVRLDDLQGEGSWRGDMLTLDPLRIAWGGAEASQRGSLQVHGSARWRGDAQLGVHSLKMSVKNLPLRALLRPFVKVAGALPKGLEADLQAQGPSLWPLQSTAELRVVAHGIPLSVLPGVPDPLCLCGRLQARPDAIALQSLRLQGDGGELLLHGSVPLRPAGLFDLFTHLHKVKPRRLLRRLLPRQRAALGPLGALQVRNVEVRAHVGGPLSAPQVRGRLQVDELSLGGQRLQLQLPFWAGATALQVKGARLQLPHGHATASLQTGFPSAVQPSPPLHARLQLQQLDLQALLPQLRGLLQGSLALDGDWQHPRGRATLDAHALGLAGLQPGHVRLQMEADGDRLTLRSFAFGDAGGAELTATGSYDLRQQKVAAEARLLALPMGWLGAMQPQGPKLAGALVGHARLRGSAKAPQLEAQLCWQKAQIDAVELGEICSRLQGNPTTWHGDLQVDGTHDLRLQLQAAQAANGALSGRLDGDVALEPLRGLLRLPLSIPGRTTVHAELAAADVGRDGPQLRLELDSEVLALSGSGRQVPGGVELQLGALRVAAGAQALRLVAPLRLRTRQGSLQMEPLRLRGEHGHLEMALARHAPPGGAPQLQARVDARLGLPLLAQWLPGLGSAEGMLEIVGHVDQLPQQPQGELRIAVVEPFSLRPQAALGEVTLCRGKVGWRPGSLRLTDLYGTLGSGHFAGEGSLRLDARTQLPQRYDLHLRGQALPFRSDALLLESNVNLAALGEGRFPRLVGTVDITGGRLNQRFTLKDFAFVATAPPSTAAPLGERLAWLSEVPLSIDARTQGDVDVRVDAGAFALRLDVGANLHVGGTALRPRLEGKVGATSGALRFPRGELAVREAVIDVVPTRSGSLDATVRLQAGGELLPRSSSRNREPQPVEVNLQLDGNLERLALEADSSPELSRLEILALLATGYANLQDVASGDGDASALDAALVFAGAQATAPLARFAEAQIQRALNVEVELGAEVTDDSLQVTAAKQMHPRLRLEGSYKRALGSDAAAEVGTRARLSLTDRLLLEGTAQQNLDPASSGGLGTQSAVQLRYRLVDR